MKEPGSAGGETVWQRCALLGLVFTLWGCSSDGDPENAAPASGGSSSGGLPATGGVTATGGAVVSGGTTVGGSGTGGMLGSGGKAQDGGAPAAGGAETGGQSGGSPTGGSGGAAPAGGSGGALAGEGGSAGASEAGAAGSSSGGSSGAGASSSEATIVPDPSWDCGMAEGIPPPAKGELVFSATLKLGDTHEVGVTPYGDRRILDVTGGSAEGDRIMATFLSGGFDFELTLANGTVELEQIDVLRADDGTLIYLRTCGVAPAGAEEVRIVPDFEVATSKSLAWLNTGEFVGTRVVDSAQGTIQLEVYDVANVMPGEPTIELVDPAGEPQQPWECSTATGGQGASVFTENVTLGSSLSVGASKRGTRNIIPITGGTTTGRVTGGIVPGGADYQLVGGNTTLDARYVLAPSDGEFILVRNCGPFGALVPLFETRADGPYAFLNENNFVSSDPGAGSGGVTITFYERQ